MSEKYPGIERRRFPRLSVRMVVIYQIDKPLTVRMQIGEREIMARVLDLSVGGMAIVTEYDLPIHTQLSIKFSLIRIISNAQMETYGPMEIKGEVRYKVHSPADGYRSGIYFTHVDHRDKLEVAKFIESAMQR